ncbi:MULTISPECIES: cytochrome b/b6 domain-containing protein [unclassified Streptomyces]|uniref:cytochrome b/b6 domain-containing protein n=1 Tax=unclassified Streptomyces TaxID=2593676 RepID=UPI0024740ECC|nr:MULTISPECIES: cytochrome b/b6 domain-containing protein [unclassified Streptomyces]
MTPRAEAHSPQAAAVRRFGPAQRWVHRMTALLMGVCVVTASFLYIPVLAEMVGRRNLVVRIHEWAGLALPVPVLIGLFSRHFRADLGHLNRFGPHDKVWLRAALRRDKRYSSRPAAKFNAGQKIYAAWIAGASLVMLATGLIMWFTHLTPIRWRTSATFVHDWLALTAGIVLAGHVGMAMADPEARAGLRTGMVDPMWAKLKHPLWRPGSKSVR